MRKKTKKAMKKMSRAMGIAAAAVVTEIVGEIAVRGIRKTTKRALKVSRRKRKQLSRADR